MPLSSAYKQRSRFLIIEQKNENTWILTVYDPRKAKGKVPVNKHPVRSLMDVRRVARAFMGRYSILPELVYHQLDELVKFLGSAKKHHEMMTENIEQDIAEDTEEPNGDNDADEVDEGTPSLHGVGEAILASPVSKS